MKHEHADRQRLRFECVAATCGARWRSRRPRRRADPVGATRDSRCQAARLRAAQAHVGLQAARAQGGTWHATPRKVFIDGKALPTWAGNYRLRLVAESDAAVKLVGGRFVMPRALARDGREHLIRWYCERAKPWLAGKVQDYAARMEVLPAGVRVQDLGYRWDHAARAIGFTSLETILLPAQIAEYVVCTKWRTCMSRITRRSSGGGGTGDAGL